MHLHNKVLLSPFTSNIMRSRNCNNNLHFSRSSNSNGNLHNTRISLHQLEVDNHMFLEVIDNRISLEVVPMGDVMAAMNALVVTEVDMDTLAGELGKQIK